MEKEQFKNKLQTARDERELGDLSKALELFNAINESELEPEQLFTYLSERGLNLWHLKKYEEAKKDFEKTVEIADELNNISYKALSLRQLSRPELNLDTPKKAVEYAKEAVDLASKAGREDIAWFDHGVVTALMGVESTSTEIESWFLKEAEDLYNVSQNTKDEIAKWVWLTGMLMDRGRVYNTKADLYAAKIIAEHFKLARRVEQINELLDQMR